MQLPKVTTLYEPRFYLDEQRCKQNISRFAQKASKHRLEFRPHFKTHHSAGVAAWFKEFGVNKCTVSSIKMLHYFANNGWHDLLLAIPFQSGAAEGMNGLPESASLNLMIDSLASWKALEESVIRKVGLFIEIDLGYGRTGISHQRISEIEKIVASARTSDKIVNISFYTHSGNSYACQDKAEVKVFHHDNIIKINDLKKHFGEIPYCYGDTPCCSVADNFKGIDCISPGNFVFYDLTQQAIGSCKQEDIANYMLAPIISINKNLRQFVLHCGSAHLSKDFLMVDGKPIFGKPFLLKDGIVSFFDNETYVTKLSQEHSICPVSQKQIEKLSVGDVVGILPVHSCLTAILQDRYYLPDGTTIEKL